MAPWLPILGWTLGFGLTLASLGYAIQHFRITSAMSYIQRMNSSDMVEIRSAVNDWLEGPESDLEKFEEAERDQVLNAKLRIFIDILTESSAGGPVSIAGLKREALKGPFSSD